MASGDSWNAGWNLGAQLAQEKNLQRMNRSNEEWEDKRDEFKTNLANLTSKYRGLLDPEGKDTPASLRVKYLLNQMQLAKDDFEQPPKGPGVIERMERLLHLSKAAQGPSVTTQPGSLQAPASDAMTLAATPTYEQATTTNGQPSKISAHMEPGTPAATLTGLDDSPAPIPSGSPVTVKGPNMTPGQLKERLAAHQRAQAETSQMLAGAPLSQREQAIQTAEANAAGGLALVKGQMAVFDELNPDATPEARKDYQDELLRKFSGTADKPAWKMYKSPDGTNEQWLDASRPDLIPPGWVAVSTENADTRKRADYAAFLRLHPDYETTGGNFEKWLSEQKTPTSALMQYEAAYRQTYNIPASEPLTLADLNYVKQQAALASQVPSSTVMNTMKVDYRGFFVPVTETNTRIPGFGYYLAPPRGNPSGAGAGAGAVPSAVQGPPTTRGAGQVPQRPRAGVSVGQYELFAGKSKLYDETLGNYKAAVDRTKTMDGNLSNALNGDQQAMLSLVANHIGMTLGAQKGARINQAVWNEAVESAPWLARATARFDLNTGLLSGVALAPDQMRQMVRLAHEKMDVLQQDLDGIIKDLNSPQRTPGTALPTQLPAKCGGKTKGKHSLSKAMSLDMNKGKTQAQVQADLQDHCYEVIP